MPTPTKPLSFKAAEVKTQVEINQQTKPSLLSQMRLRAEDSASLNALQKAQSKKMRQTTSPGSVASFDEKGYISRHVDLKQFTSSPAQLATTPPASHAAKFWSNPINIPTCKTPITCDELRTQASSHKARTYNDTAVPSNSEDSGMIFKMDL